MRKCPICLATFDGAAKLCPVDGAPLLSADPLLGKVVDGRYRLDAALGAGGQGVVYRATHLQLRRPVALKALRPGVLVAPDALKRFQREALTLAQIDHPLIVKVYDFGSAPEVGTYLVMELLEGRSLREELKAASPVEPLLALDVARQVCEALEAAHTGGVTHRDVKPGNVFLTTPPGRGVVAKVLDFGLAVPRPGGAGAAVPDELAEITATGAIMGTPAYLAPEQAEGRALDERSDVYSLGCVLYEMLTGSLPFRSQSVDGMLRSHLVGRVVPPSEAAGGVSPDVDALLLRALEKRPERRYQSAREFAEAIAEVRARLAGERPPAARGPGRGPRAGSPGPAGAAAAPALEAARPAPPNNLPQETTSFVGRERDVREVSRLLAENRLVTVTGPGGSGKTRLSLRIAAARLGDYPDGAWVVDLAPLSDASFVPQAFASALGAREEPGRALVDSLAGALRFRRALLVVDNCEHLVAACAEVVRALVRACPTLSVLATSQEALGVPGEVVWTLRPLSLPGEGSAGVGGVGRSEAVRLFVDRARLSDPGFELTEENAAAVARVCRRLDGVPLAIELAAARVKLLSVEQIDERLDDRFRLLTSGSRTAEARQRTLRAAVDWSYELLTPAARAALNRLSVFSGGLDLAAAEAVCAGDGIDEADVIDLLASLVDKSLVVKEERGGAARYNTLETLRHYGAGRLRESGEAAAVRARHRAHFRALAEAAARELSGPRQAEWLDRLDLEHDNLRAALESSRDDGSGVETLRIAARLAPFWSVRGHALEGRAWLEEALSRAEGAPDALRAEALLGVGELALLQNDYERAVAARAEALSLYRTLGDRSGAARALNGLGFAAQWQGDSGQAEALHEEALALARESGDLLEEACALNNLGAIARRGGARDAAAERIRTSLELFRQAGHLLEVASTLNNLGIIAAEQNDLARAAELLEEHLSLSRALGDRRGTAISLNNLGEVARQRGDARRAASLLAESLALYREVGDRRGIAYSLESFASLAATCDDPYRAICLLGASAALREAIDSPLAGDEQADLDRQLAAARGAVGEDEAARAEAAGRALTLEAACAYAAELAEATRAGREA